MRARIRSNPRRRVSRQPQAALRRGFNRQKEIIMAVSAPTKGTIVEVLGAVVDIEFPPDKLPPIYNAVETHIEGVEKPLTLEVEQHLGNNWVRCVAMGPT